MSNGSIGRKDILLVESLLAVRVGWKADNRYPGGWRLARLALVDDSGTSLAPARADSVGGAGASVVLAVGVAHEARTILTEVLEPRALVHAVRTVPHVQT